MKILVVGLRKEKTHYLEEEFPNHKFVVRECAKNTPTVKKKAKGDYDLVISMSYHIHHAAEKAVISSIGTTPFIRVPGNISNLKQQLHKL